MPPIEEQIKKESEEFLAYCEDVRKRGRAPKYAINSIVEGLAKRNHYEKFGEFLVRLRLLPDDSTVELKWGISKDVEEALVKMGALGTQGSAV